MYVKGMVYVFLTIRKSECFRSPELNVENDSLWTLAVHIVSDNIYLKCMHCFILTRNKVEQEHSLFIAKMLLTSRDNYRSRATIQVVYGALWTANALIRVHADSECPYQGICGERMPWPGLMWTANALIRKWPYKDIRCPLTEPFRLL